MKLSLRTFVIMSLAGSLGACEPAAESVGHRRSKVPASGKALFFSTESIDSYCLRGMYAEACHLIAVGR